VREFYALESLWEGAEGHAAASAPRRSARRSPE